MELEIKRPATSNSKDKFARTRVHHDEIYTDREGGRKGRGFNCKGPWDGGCEGEEVGGKGGSGCGQLSIELAPGGRERQGASTGKPVGLASSPTKPKFSQQIM